MRIPVYRIVNQNAPREARIKYWTHAAGAASFLFVIPSACAVYLGYLGKEESEPMWVTAAFTIWCVHGALILLTAILALFENPRHVRYVSTEADIARAPGIEPPVRVRSLQLRLALSGIAGVGAWWFAWNRIEHLRDGHVWQVLKAGDYVYNGIVIVITILTGAIFLIGPCVFVCRLGRRRKTEKVAHPGGIDD